MKPSGFLRASSSETRITHRPTPHSPQPTGIWADCGGFQPSEVSERMTPLIEQALSLDRNLAEAWESLASVRWAQGDLEGAQAARDRAFELDPQHPQVLTGQIYRWLYSHEPERGSGIRRRTPSSRPLVASQSER